MRIKLENLRIFGNWIDIMYFQSDSLKIMFP